MLPADKVVTIHSEKTTVAKMHNELRDTPKTGDDSKPWLWITLMGVSSISLIAIGIAALKRNQRKRKMNHGIKTIVAIGLVLLLWRGLCSCT